MTAVKFYTIAFVSLSVSVIPTYSANIDRPWRTKLNGDSEAAVHPILVSTEDISVPNLIQVQFPALNKVVIKETNTPAVAAQFLSKDSNLNYIGDRGGRSFFESPTWLNWYQSKEYCEGLGLELAVLDSAHCWDFIYYRIEPYTVYWTAGKDAETKDQFLNFGRNRKLKLPYIHSRVIKSESCIGLHGSSRYWTQEHCLEQKFVLCQSLDPQN